MAVGARTRPCCVTSGSAVAASESCPVASWRCSGSCQPKSGRSAPPRPPMKVEIEGRRGWTVAHFSRSGTGSRLSGWPRGSNPLVARLALGARVPEHWSRPTVGGALAREKPRTEVESLERRSGRLVGAREQPGRALSSPGDILAEEVLRRRLRRASRFVARILSRETTLQMQGGRDVVGSLRAARMAAVRCQPAPSLVPNP